MMFKIISIIILLITNKAYSQWTMKGCDELLYFKPGSGQSFGQNEPYFPNNIFGLPDTNATANVPSSSPWQICSIGLDGEIAVGFSGYLLYNKPGPDFTIFENAFINPVNGKVFAEPAIVSVSIDGIKFIDFPCDTITLEGCAGKTPTIGKNNPFDPSLSGGDSFDLDMLGLEYIRYIRIKDISRVIRNNKNHPFYDPTISGFDLDAVVGLALVKENSVNDNELNRIWTMNNNKLIINYSDRFFVDIISIEGKKLFQYYGQNPTIFNLGDYPRGIYFIVIKSNLSNQCLKFIKYE